MPRLPSIPTPALLAAVLALAAATAVAAAPAMAASTYYAAPGGVGTECSQAAPCSLPASVTKAATGDAVVLLPGAYSLASTLLISRSISLGGESETTTTIQTVGGASIEVNEVANATLHDFRVDTTQTFELKTGTAERVFVDYTGTEAGHSACSVDQGVSLLDSVCWAHGGSPSAGAIFSESTGFGGGKTVTLRNVTAIAANAEGAGILGEVESPGTGFTIAATNVIARGGGPDVWIYNGGGATSHATVALMNSNYATVKEQNSGTSVTAPGTNGNQTAAPAFLAAATGDFAEAPGSPTIDAGATEAANGVTALAGESRVLPGACGGAPATDIGAYEFIVTGCPPPPPTSLPPPAPPTHTPPSNKVTHLKLKRNAKKGTGTLLVSVPGAGTLLLTGKGIAKADARSTAAARLKLPIKPIGQAKRRLARTGTAKLHLRLTFLPVGGSLGTVMKSVKLTER